MPYLHWFSSQHCGNCGRTSDFQLLYAHPLSVKSSDDRLSKWVASDSEYRALSTCNYCHYPYMLDLTLRPITYLHKKELGVDNFKQHMVIKFLNRLAPVITWSPGPGPRYSSGMAYQEHEWGQCLHKWFDITARHPDSTLKTPTALPTELAKGFNELFGVRSVPRFTVIACRSLLEKACKYTLGDEGRDTKLIQLINNAIKRLKTVEAIADWAHTIRVIGNDAVHGDEYDPTPAEADEAVRFTTLFLELLFSYPERIKTLKK